MVANQCHSLNGCFDLGIAVLIQEVLYILRELVLRHAAGQMPQGQHRVRLAATEVGLQVDHRRCIVVATEPADRSADEIPQPFFR